MLVGAVACSEAPRPANPGLWTLLDARALYESGAGPDQALATDAGLPGGIPLGGMLGEDGVTLTVRRAFAEGYDAGYVTTEIWSWYERVWLQPLYVPIVGWDAGGKPIPLAPKGAAWVFGVGAASGFYSPFWEMIYVEVPDGTTGRRGCVGAPDPRWRIPLHPGPGRTVVLAPGTDMVVPAGLGVGSGWLDGAPAPFIDFGQGLFSWREAGERPGSSTSSLSTSSRSTAPTGRWPRPPWFPRCWRPDLPARGCPSRPSSPGNRAYSAFWRLYRVTLPLNARVFAPGGYAGIDAALRAAGAPTVTSYGAITGAEPDAQPYLGKVAVDAIDPATNAPACFADLNLLEPGSVDSCHWLDAQVAIDSLLDPSLIEPTEITVTAPVVHGPRHPRCRRCETPVASRSLLFLVRVRRARPGRPVAQPQVPRSRTRRSTTATATRRPPQGPGAPSPLSINGYVDIGFARAQGDGTSFAPGDTRLPADYGVDTVRARGELAAATSASTDAGGRFVNGFLPRSVGIGGRASFLINTVNLDFKYAPGGRAGHVSSRACSSCRASPGRGTTPGCCVEQAFGRLVPFDSQELALSVGKFDSVFGIEYLDNQANIRTGVTPSLVARYTTGPVDRREALLPPPARAALVGVQPQRRGDQQRKLRRGAAAARRQPHGRAGRLGTPRLRAEHRAGPDQAGRLGDRTARATISPIRRRMQKLLGADARAGVPGPLSERRVRSGRRGGRAVRRRRQRDSSRCRRRSGRGAATCSSPTGCRSGRALPAAQADRVRPLRSSPRLVRGVHADHRRAFHRRPAARFLGDGDPQGRVPGQPRAGRGTDGRQQRGHHVVGV